MQRAARDLGAATPQSHPHPLLTTKSTAATSRQLQLPLYLRLEPLSALLPPPEAEVRQLPVTGPRGDVTSPPGVPRRPGVPPSVNHRERPSRGQQKTAVSAGDAQLKRAWDGGRGPEPSQHVPVTNFAARKVLTRIHVTNRTPRSARAPGAGRRLR